MRLELTTADLKKEHADVSCSRTRFEHFSADAQEAIRVVGQATFYRRKGGPDESYNVIYPPENAVICHGS